MGYKFTSSQFKKAIEKRVNKDFNLKGYLRNVPKSKKKLNELEISTIKDYLDIYSRESSSKDINVKYLEYSKKFIYNKYINDPITRKISYNTFLQYCPKNFKKGKKRTDVCGICEIGKKLSNINVKSLNSRDKKEYNRNIDILNKHKKVVENQKWAYNHIINNLDNESCVLILDFKENFKLSHGGNEISYDFYNKRQVSCMGAALIFNNNNQLKVEYVSYFSNILSHDSLFSGDVLELFINELDTKYRSVHIFTDCGPHFRSKEFICRVKNISNERKISVSLNFFAEYHGKSIVDGFFGRLSQLFQKIDYRYSINTIEEFKEAFNKEAIENNWKDVYFRVYHRESRDKPINKINMKKIKSYLSYLFQNNKCYYSYLTNFNNTYKILDSNDTQEEDKRTTNLTPGRVDELRIKRYFNDRVKSMYDERMK